MQTLKNDYFSLYLIGLMVILSALIVVYHRIQNKANRMGGPMSSAKSLWLGLTLYNYFIIPPLAHSIIQEQSLCKLLLVVISLFYFRLIVQSFLMFVTKNWIPTYGIVYNVFSALVMLLVVLNTWSVAHFHLSLDVKIVGVLSIQLLLMLLTDTYYAKKFHAIVGGKTKGAKAIWYASDAEEFRTINKITARNNWFFASLIAILVVMLTYRDLL